MSIESVELKNGNRGKTTGSAQAGPVMPDLSNPLILVHVSRNVKMCVKHASIHPVMVTDGETGVPRMVEQLPVMMQFGTQLIPYRYAVRGPDGTVVPYTGTREAGWINVDKWFIENQTILGLADSDYAEIRKRLLTPPTENKFSEYGVSYCTPEPENVAKLQWGVAGERREIKSLT